MNYKDSSDYFSAKEKMLDEAKKAQVKGKVDEFFEKQEKRDVKQQTNKDRISSLRGSSKYSKGSLLKSLKLRLPSFKRTSFSQKQISGTTKLLGLDDSAKQFVKSKKSRQNKTSRSNSKNISNLDKTKVLELYAQQKKNKLSEDQIRHSELSENTKKMLMRLLEIQTKSKRDDQRMQRILREKKILSDASNLLKAENMFTNDGSQMKHWINGFEDGIGNPLLAPNTFKEIPENRIIKTNRPNILQTSKEYGSQLDFFGSRSQSSPKIKSKKSSSSRLSFWRS